MDYDHDGRPDILVLGRNRCRLFRNETDGRFREVTSGSGLPQEGEWIGCAAGDYDNDGDPDLLLNGYGCIALLRNDGRADAGPSFADVTRAAGLRLAGGSPPFGTSAAWGDYDGDGRLDLYVCRYVHYREGMEKHCRARSGGLATCPPDRYAPQRGSLYRNLGQIGSEPRFEDVTHPTGADSVHGKAFGAVFLDFDADGRQDLYVANDEMPGDLLQNVNGRRFENVGVQSGTAYDPDGRVHGGMGVDAGDYDSDGRMDILVTTFVKEPYSLYRNNGDRTFTDQAAMAGIGLPTTPFSGWGTRLFDWDNDGRLDVLFVNGHATDSDRDPLARPDLEQPMQLFRNGSKGGRFEPVSLGLLDAPIIGRGAAFGDYDSDGFTDALVCDLEGQVLLLHNEAGRSAARFHWIGLSLEGVRSNRDGLGARVTLRTAAGTQVAEVRTCGSVYSSHDPRLRFGLGAQPSVRAIEVRWPGGKTERFQGLAPDRYHSIREGSGSGARASRPHRGPRRIGARASRPHRDRSSG